MTVLNPISKYSYSGNGSTTVFSFPTYFISNADVKAKLVDGVGAETPLVLTTDYTMTGAGNPAGGSLTAVVAPPVGKTIVIYLDPAITQEAQYTETGKFPAASHEKALDKLTQIAQRQKNRLDEIFTDISGAGATAVSAVEAALDEAIDDLGLASDAEIQDIEDAGAAEVIDVNAAGAIQIGLAAAQVALATTQAGNAATSAAAALASENAAAASAVTADPTAALAAEFAKAVYAAAGPGTIKAVWDFKGPRTAYLGSGTILTQLDSLDPTPLALGLHSSLYSGADPRPIYDASRGIYLAANSGLQLLATSLLGHTTGDFAVIATFDLNTVTTTIGLEASLPVSPSIVEGDMTLVNADANTTFTPDVKDVRNIAYADSQLKNGYFKGIGISQTHSRGPYTLMRIAGTTTYLSFDINHIGQVRGYLYSGSGGVLLETIVIGTVVLGMSNLTLALRRHKNLLSIWLNGEQHPGKASLILQADITDLTNLYINGSARIASTSTPITNGLRQYFKGLVIGDNLPDANFRAVYNEIAQRYGTPLLVRARRARGVIAYGQSWTEGAISTTGTTNTPTVSGNLWNGQITKTVSNAGEDSYVTREAFPNVFAARTTDSHLLNNGLVDDIAPLEYTVTSSGNLASGHSVGSSGENFILGMMAQLNLEPEALKDDWIISGLGLGGRTLALLTAKSATFRMNQLKTAPISSTDLYYRMLRQIVYARDFALSRGQPYSVDLFVYQQGQSDSAINSTYVTDWPAFRTMVIADIKTITGQAHDPEFIVPQVSYGNTPSQRCNSNIGNCIDQLWLDFEDAGLLHCTGPIYQITPHVHPPRLGHRWDGELKGYYTRKILYGGEGYGSLRPYNFVSAAASSAIAIDYRIRDTRALIFVDQNDNAIHSRRTLDGVDTYGFEFYRKILGTPNYSTLPANSLTISATTGVVTCNSHGLIAGDKVKFGSLGVLPTGYVNGTEYFVINPTTNTFGLSATLAGAQIAVSGTSSGTHWLYDTTVKIASVVIPSSTVTITIASPGVISWTAHGLAIGNKVRFTTTGALPAGLLPNTDYYVATVPTANTFTVALAINQLVSINTTGSQSGVHTCTSGNRVYVNLDTALSGSAGSRGVLKYTGEFGYFGNLCDGAKIDGIYPYQDWAGATWASNEPMYLPGAVNDLRQWAVGFTKIL